nr:MAG TPA: hypothetical protein [Caudoviricetes sp.]
MKKIISWYLVNCNFEIKQKQCNCITFAMQVVLL